MGENVSFQPPASPVSPDLGMDLEPFPEVEEEDDEIVLQQRPPTNTKPAFQLLGGFSLEEIDEIWPDDGEPAPELSEEIKVNHL